MGEELRYDNERKCYELRTQLQDLRRLRPLMSALDPTEDPLPPEQDIEANTDVETGRAVSTTSQACPPENAGGENVAELHAQIELLEKRCITLQKKLNARPIMSTDTNSNPLQLSTTGTSDVVLANGSRMAVVQQQVEVQLRSFTQWLLKRDSWLWMFYVHLLVLYAFSATCLASGTSTSCSDCVEMTVKQNSP